MTNVHSVDDGAMTHGNPCAHDARFTDAEGLPPDEAREFDPWYDDLENRSGGDDFGRLIVAARSFTDALAASAPDTDDMRELTGLLERMRTILDRTRTAPRAGHSGRRHDLPGRGHPLMVPFDISRWTTNRVEGIARFGAAHVGGRGAVHGGFPPVLFDEILGSLSNTNRVTSSRTAYLHCDYRSVVLPDQPYRLVATVDREVGRKRYLSATLTGPDGTLAVEANALFVVLREGQP
jgi:acyl-coenzyme A thioesterase PaaI-like protein